MGARTPGFQWFVAWRYLMARPRRLSGIILVAAMLFAWVLLADGFAAGVMSLTDTFISAGMPIPAWLPTALGSALAVAPVVLCYLALRELMFSGRRPRRPVAAAAGVSLVAGLALLGSGLVEVMRTGEIPVTARIGALVLMAAPLILLCAHPTSISRRSIIFVTIASWMALGWMLLALQRDQGELIHALALEGDAPIWLEPGVLAPAALAVLALGAAFGLRRRGALAVAGLAGALIVAGFAYEVWLRLAAYSAAETLRPASGIEFRTPVVVIIPAALGGVLLLLSLLLLGIRYMFTFFTTVSIGGVAIGTMALVITLSVMSGFESDLREKILGSNAHILISREDEQPFREYKDVMKAVARAPGTIGMSPYLETEVVVAGSSNYFNVVVRGIDPRTIARVTDLRDDLEDRESLERMWPMEDDGGLGAPPDAGPAAEQPQPTRDAGALDPAPDDMNVGDTEPEDFSGAGAGAEPEPEPEPEPEVVDPAPADMNVGDTEPDDYSGEEGMTHDALIDAIEGVEVTAEGQVGPRKLPPEVAALPGVLVGRELVKQINLYVGQEVKIISPLGQNTLAGQTPYIKPYRVAGVFFTGMYEYDLKRVYVELSTLQDFLDVPDVASGIEIRVSDPEDTDAVVAALHRNIGSGYRIQDWKELNRSLFSALKLEKIAMFLVLAIIILVASFSIVGNLIMVVIEKAREIAVLKTLGASDGGVTRIFIVQGFLIGLVGTLIGVSLGLAVCYIADTFGIGIPPDVYYIDRLPIHVDLYSVGVVAAAGVVISVAATIYPARIAARLRPVQGLRYE
ncbi:MAG TPA: FtsX-like permease family protein [Kofleriaceae bacterium]|nr:FtsX-like permease family protein [Kofleriaceae bacterium]